MFKFFRSIFPPLTAPPAEVTIILIEEGDILFSWIQKVDLFSRFNLKTVSIEHVIPSEEAGFMRHWQDADHFGNEIPTPMGYIYVAQTRDTNEVIIVDSSGNEKRFSKKSFSSVSFSENNILEMQ